MTKYAENVKKELTGMFELGMISKSRLNRAFDYIKSEEGQANLVEYERSGCRISDAADLVTYM